MWENENSNFIVLVLPGWKIKVPFTEVGMVCILNNCILNGVMKEIWVGDFRRICICTKSCTIHTVLVTKLQVSGRQRLFCCMVVSYIHWGIGSSTTVDTKIWECSSSLYKMAQNLHITFGNLHIILYFWENN
jgi:hypothetical protein